MLNLDIGTLIAEADGYLSASVDFDVWSDAESASRQRALISARRQIDALITGVQVPEQPYKNAIFEQAAFLLNEEVQDAIKTRQKGIKSVSAGSVSESYADADAGSTAVNGMSYAPMATAIIKPYLTKRKISSGRLVP